MILTISKGQQITIPADIRNHFGLDVGSKIEMETKNDTIVIRAIGEDLEKVFAATKHLKPKKHMTAEEMDEFVRRKAGEIHR